MGESGFGGAALAKVFVNHGTKAAAVKLVENGKKSSERVDIVGF